ncbi:MAG: phenylalanine--tRNA ligase subunit beta [Candidatus Aenigmarchaeota archaeon]|nr:phenylalanine--tRNA ligase subunit beta [Candidatus Aenigmarchaeota archaeon]
MPTIEVNYEDLQELVGKHIPLDVLQEEGIMYAKGEVDEIEGETLKLDMKDTNRPDLWSAEGIARELQGRYAGITGLPEYNVQPSGLVVKVDRKLKNIRPLTVCAVVKNLNINHNALSQMIQLQEKISMTFGRNRKEVAIGVYDFHKIKGPIRFTSVKPNGIRFVPLEFTKPMTPEEILKKHPKGREYAHLLEGFHEYPIFIDSAGEVLSLPPIINSNHTGKVTTATRDVFIECSGFDFRLLMPALNTIVAALADRGGEVQSVKVEYGSRTVVTPDMKPGKTSLDIDYANMISGLNLDARKMSMLLKQARYDAKVRGKKIDLLYPAYRQDIMHQRDIVEDLIISYGFGRAEPVIPKIQTAGGVSRLQKLTDTAAEVMTGMQFQEIMSYMLTNKGALFEKMGMPKGSVVEIENTVSANWSVFRDRLLPGLLEFLSKNKHREYPQRIFESGDVVIPDSKAETGAVDRRHLSAAASGSGVGYEYMAGVLNAFMKNIGTDFSLKASNYPSFIEGRCAEITVSEKVIGIIGEIHPKVLNMWGIENPVVAFELDIEKAFTSAS